MKRLSKIKFKYILILLCFQVCSRFDGSRILVVRGSKNLDTCGLMDQKLYKKNTNMDIEHNRVKVTFERPAEHLGLIDIDMDVNTGREDMSEDIKVSRVTNQKQEIKSENKFDQYHLENDTSKSNKSKQTHRKRHAKRWHHKIEHLKNLLESKFITFSP